MRYLIRGGQVVNEFETQPLDVLIEGDRIAAVGRHLEVSGEVEVIDAEGCYVLPGCIDDQVHFREPGLTHKANIHTESRAAVAGGITSFMEMPNTVPNTVTQELLEEKYAKGAADSVANYSFFMGATNDNLEEVLKTDPKRVCGVKVFMGSSTGNMLVDKEEVLEKLFANCSMLIATHCEDEKTVRQNMEKAKAEFGEEVPITEHPIIRSHEACYLSSSMAVELAKKHDARLHILHISTAKELELFEPGPIDNKRITAEACVHHLWFKSEDYVTHGSRIKWNPAVKNIEDREAIRQAVNEGRIDVIATDHAPHTKEEKDNTYFKAPSGGPLVQHMLPALLDLVHEGVFTLEQVVHKTSHAVAKCFHIENRGYVREGYFADLVVVNMDKPFAVTESNIEYKCGWSPFEGHTFKSSVQQTFVSGKLAYNQGEIHSDVRGQRMTFDL